MTNEDRSLLKEEYFQLQNAVEEFDQRGLTIKAWSVTTSMVGIATSFLYSDAVFLCLLSAFASLSFWITEAYWKYFQQCYYPCIREIEMALRAPQHQIAPLQINTSWSKANAKYREDRFLIKILLWPQIMLPHVLVALVGFGIWFWRISGFKTPS